MKKIVISDSEGKIITIQDNVTGDLTDYDVTIVEVPEGKMLVGINPETNEPIFADIPPSEIEILKDRTQDLELMLAKFIMGGF